MPPAERRALLLLLGLAVAGQGVRYVFLKANEPPGQVQLLATLAAGSPGAQRDSAMQLGRPLGSAEKIDVETASSSELARLPKVGPRLAKEIVANRAEQGPFQSLAGLDRVPGVGPGLLKVIGPHVAFSGTAAAPVNSPGAQLPITSRVALNLNSATTEQLLALPGIGPAKAAAILRYRSEHGPFSKPEDLSRVSGFGPSALLRLQGLITAP